MNERKFEYYDTSYCGDCYLMKIEVESGEIFVKSTTYADNKWAHIWNNSIGNVLKDGAERISDEDLFMRMI